MQVNYTNINLKLNPDGSKYKHLIKNMTSTLKIV